MRTSVIAGTALLAGVVALSGCSSSTKGSGSAGSSATSSSAASSPSTVSTSASTSASPTAAPPSTATLLGITLQTGDLPTTWQATPYQADPTDKSDQAALVTCAGGKDTSPDQIGEQHSPDYGLDDASISSEADSFKSQSDVDADVALINNPKTSACYNQLAKSEIEPSLPSGSTVNSAAITITPGANGGPSNVVGTGTGQVNVTVQGQTATVYLNVAFITGPLIEAEVDFENIGSPVPADLQAAAIKAVATRAAAG